MNEIPIDQCKFRALKFYANAYQEILSITGQKGATPVDRWEGKKIHNPNKIEIDYKSFNEAKFTQQGRLETSEDIKVAYKMNIKKLNSKFDKPLGKFQALLDSLFLKDGNSHHTVLANSSLNDQEVEKINNKIKHLNDLY